MPYVTYAFRVVLLKLEVLSHQHDVRDGDLLMVEVCGRSLADHDHLEMRIRQTNLGSPHLSFRRAQVSPSRFELLDHVAGMAQGNAKRRPPTIGDIPFLSSFSEVDNVAMAPAV